MIFTKEKMFYLLRRWKKKENNKESKEIELTEDEKKKDIEDVQEQVNLLIIQETCRQSLQQNLNTAINITIQNQ